MLMVYSVLPLLNGNKYDGEIAILPYGHFHRTNLVATLQDSGKWFHSRNTVLAKNIQETALGATLFLTEPLSLLFFLNYNQIKRTISMPYTQI